MNSKPVATTGQTLPPQLIGLGVVRHNLPIVRLAKRLTSAAGDDLLKPLPYSPKEPEVITAALRIARVLPSYDDLVDADIAIGEALDGRPASMKEASVALAAILSARVSFKPERSESYFPLVLELIAMIEPPPTLDLLVLALMTQLETSKWTPEPSEIIEAIRDARRRLKFVSEHIARLIGARASADDILIAAGLREPDDDSNSPIPFMETRK